MSRSSRRDVQSVDRAMVLLAALGEAGCPLGVRELSARVMLPRPTVYRLLQTLEHHGAVTAADGRFMIGPRILWLAAQRLEHIELRTVGRPFLLDLRDRTGETVHLAVLEQGQVVYVDKVEPPGPMRMASAVGKIMPAHCTALGKAMLAHLPREQVREVLARHGMPQRTRQTITNADVLLAELDAVRARGYAVDNVENEEGIRCVGAAIFDHRGEVVGAVSVSGAVRALTLERIRRDLGPCVRDTAEWISRAMGWQTPRRSATAEGRPGDRRTQTRLPGRMIPRRGQAAVVSGRTRGPARAGG
ncbi:MAG: IclR family transcriptional regulator [Armatimonadota bacterium]|nr:IclR family transcriptional regulator [Armatimonadota bacterium]